MTAPAVRPARPLACGKPSIFDNTLRATGFEDAAAICAELDACFADWNDHALSLVTRSASTAGIVPNARLAAVVLRARRVGDGS